MVSDGFAIPIKRIEIAVVLRTRCLFYSSSHLKVPVSVSVFVALSVSTTVSVSVCLCACPWTLDPGPWTPEPGAWILDPGPWTLRPVRVKHRNSGCPSDPLSLMFFRPSLCVGDRDRACVKTLK